MIALGACTCHLPDSGVDVLFVGTIATDVVVSTTRGSFIKAFSSGRAGHRKTTLDLWFDHNCCFTSMAAGRKVILVSTCTNNKTVSADENKKLRNCSSFVYDQAIPGWCESLWSGSDELVSAKTLYAGTHWGETIKAHDKLVEQPGLSPELWILSAGCGLIPANLEVPAYSATFSSGADGIHELIWQPGWTPKERAQYWWKEINASKPKGVPRRLSDIESDADTLVIRALQGVYACHRARTFRTHLQRAKSNDCLCRRLCQPPVSPSGYSTSSFSSLKNSRPIGGFCTGPKLLSMQTLPIG